MKRRNEQSIGEILQQYLRMTQVENLVYEDQIAQAWQTLMGDAVVRETARIHLQGGCLFIDLRSSALRQELLMRRRAIARAVNEHIGGDIVKTVVIR